MSDDKNIYDARKIKVLEGLKAVQERPGMYIGDISFAFEQMFKEVLENCIDEYTSGNCEVIDIKFDTIKNIVSIADNGRGIPIDIHPTEHKPALEVIMTTLHSGGKFDDDSYKFSIGLHGVGVSVVNALATWLDAEVYRNNKTYFMRFENGVTAIPLKVIGTSEKTGTKITFTPNFKIIGQQQLNLTSIRKRLREICYLNKGLKIILSIDTEKSEEFFSSGGILDFFKDINKGIEFIDIIHVDQLIDGGPASIRACLGWGKGDENEKIIAFTNKIQQEDLGTHVTGLKNAISRSVSNYIEQLQKNEKEKIDINSDDIRKNFHCILCIEMKDPKFASQTKSKLVSPEARTIVETSISEFLTDWLEKNPKKALDIYEKAKKNALFRHALLKWKENYKKTEVDTDALLSGHLIRSENSDELFIMEGISAAGTTLQARERNQAALPLRGKFFNVQRVSEERVLASEKILPILAAIGTGIGPNFNINKLKYKKIILMPDADCDGAHICCLLITLFMKLLPEVVKNGHIYITKAPLFRLSSSNKKYFYVENEEELYNILVKKILEKYIISDISGKILTIADIIEIRKVSKEFIKNLDKMTTVLDRNLLRFALTYNVFNDFEKFAEYSLKVLNFHVKKQMIGEEIQIKSASIYGGQTGKLSLEDMKYAFNLHVFPITIKDIRDENKKTIVYDPIEFIDKLEAFFKSEYKINRYKGLGEMNPDQLYETSMNPKTRKLIQVQFIEDEEELFRKIDEIMGNNNERREFIMGLLLKFRDNLHLLSDNESNLQ